MTIATGTETHKFPAQEHASKVAAELGKLVPAGSGTQAIFLQACPVSCRDDTDRELLFRALPNAFLTARPGGKL